MAPADLEEIKIQLWVLIDKISFDIVFCYWCSRLSQRRLMLRFCFDYMQLNQAIVRNKYFFYRTINLLGMIKKDKVFSTISSRSECHQLHIRESDIPKIAF